MKARKSAARGKSSKKNKKKKGTQKTAAAKILRHDTPLDPPLAPLAVVSFDPHAAPRQALERVRRIETIQGAYEAWLELRLEYCSALKALADEQKQLEQQGEFLVGAVRAARELAQAPTVEEVLSLARLGTGLDGYLVETASRLAAAKEQLETRSRAVHQAFSAALAQIRVELRARISRTLSFVKPQLKLMIRALGPNSRILHVARLQADEAVLLAWVLLDKLPSRYDFLFDDSTENASLPSPTLYADDGLLPGFVRPTLDQLQALMKSDDEVIPIKSVVPFFLPRVGGPPQLIRLVERGPVMEVEIGDAEAFRNVLSRDEAERVAGFFLRLKLENRVEIQLLNS